MILSLTHKSEEFTRTRWGFENCIERNKIVQIHRNNYSCYILSNLTEEDLKKTNLPGTGILMTPKW